MSVDAQSLAVALCITSHHALTLAPSDMPCEYHAKRAEDVWNAMQGNSVRLPYALMRELEALNE